MPGIITHFLCAEAAAADLPADDKLVLRRYKGLYRVGAQGPDIFFYYLPGFIGGGFPKIGTDMHSGGVSRFAAAVADKLTSLRDGDAKERLLSYFAGYLTHYCLDYTAHPYIYYKTGFSKGGKPTPLTSAAHRRFETNLDVAMLATRHGAKPNDRRLYRLLAVNRADASSLSHALAEIISGVYNRKITTGQVRRSIVVARFCAGALQSGKGRRARLVRALEGAAGYPGAVSSLIHPQAPKGKDPLNLSHKPWLLPYDKEARYSESFLELFETAAERARDMIAALFDYAREGATDKEELLRIIGDNSLKTGAAAGSGVTFRYHERKRGGVT